MDRQMDRTINTAAWLQLKTTFWIIIAFTAASLAFGRLVKWVTVLYKILLILFLWQMLPLHFWNSLYHAQFLSDIYQFYISYIGGFSTSHFKWFLPQQTCARSIYHTTLVIPHQLFEVRDSSKNSSNDQTHQIPGMFYHCQKNTTEIMAVCHWH